jgi:hypothetical protein
VKGALRLALLPLVICSLARGFQQGTDADVYAIYSLMLANPPTSHGPDNNKRYLIATTTVPGYPPVPCVSPPKEREADFREVLADYELRKSSPRELKLALSIPKPSVLLSATEVGEFIKEHTPTRNGMPILDPRFEGASDLFGLSDVYFNSRRTLALTGISTWCGSACGLYQWKVFEKLDTGKWEERRWVYCSGMARNLGGSRVQSSAAHL